MLLCFYERLLKICEKNNVKLTPLIKKLGYSTGSLTNWKNGTMPNGDIIIVFANYFNISTDYLLGLTDIPNHINIESVKTSSSYPNELLDSIKLKTDSPVAAYEGNGIEHISKVTNVDLDKMLKKNSKKITFPLDLNGNIENVELTEHEYKVLNSTLRGLRGLI